MPCHDSNICLDIIRSVTKMLQGTEQSYPCKIFKIPLLSRSCLAKFWDMTQKIKTIQQTYRHASWGIGELRSCRKQGIHSCNLPGQNLNSCPTPLHCLHRCTSFVTIKFLNYKHLQCMLLGFHYSVEDSPT